MSAAEVCSSRKSDCVVVDTNLWRSELLLKTPLGAALLYILGRRGGYLGLPEVVEREVAKHIVQAGLTAGEAITKNLRTIEVLMGSRPDCPIPSAEQLEQAVKDRMAEIVPFIVRVPFTLEHATTALDMVNAEVPPNGPKNQQFKDSAIWRAVLDLARHYHVYFVTNDRAFLRDPKEPSKGLALNLDEDCRRAGVLVSVYVDLGSCLQKLRIDVPPLDQDHLAAVIDAVINPQVRNNAANRGFTLGGIIDSSVAAFITEKPDILALDFELMYRLEESTQVGENARSDALVIAKGSCFYDQRRIAVSDARISSEQFEWTESEGVKQAANIYASGNIILGGGRQQISYRVRRPVD